jgi:hypothetical protein
MKLYVSESENVESAYYGMIEQNLEPPEYDEPIEVDNIEEEVEFNFEINIAVDGDSIDEYDMTNDWGKNPDDPKGNWETWGRPSVVFADADKVCEDLFEVLFNVYTDSIPKQSGDYVLKGEASLKYIISEIQYDEDNDEYYTDYMEVELDMKQSSINNLEFIPK